MTVTSENYLRNADSNGSNGGNFKSFKSGSNNLGPNAIRGDTEMSISKISDEVDDDEKSDLSTRKDNADFRGTKSKFTEAITEHQRQRPMK